MKQWRAPQVGLVLTLPCSHQHQPSASHPKGLHRHHTHFNRHKTSQSPLALPKGHGTSQNHTSSSTSLFILSLCGYWAIFKHSGEQAYSFRNYFNSQCSSLCKPTIDAPTVFMICAKSQGKWKHNFQLQISLDFATSINWLNLAMGLNIYISKILKAINWVY